MNIQQMNRDECLEVLADTRLARLACVQEGQPYIVPVYIALARSLDGEPCLYGFTTIGQKVEWMRANPLVCVEVDNVVASDHWLSVVVFGRYEELPDTLGQDGDWPRTPGYSRPGSDEGKLVGEVDERLLAYNALRAQASWWRPGFSAHVPPAPGRLAPIYYRVSIDRVSGHRATPDSQPAPLPAEPAEGEGWLRGLLHFFGRPHLP